MRIVFCGTPEFAVPSLRRLLSDSSFSIEAVVTQPDRPRGRTHAVSASPVKQAALEAGTYVYQPESVKSDSAYEFVKRIAPDAVVIIAYGQIIPQRLIDVPRLGWINLHASLLPKYRGAAPINWAIVNGETTTGLTTMRIDAGMDTGPILLQQEIAIGTEETAPELTRRMSAEGAALVADTLQKLERGGISPRAQDGSQASLAPRLTKERGLIDWNRSAHEIYNAIRGFAPWPGAYTKFRGQLCHVWGRPDEATTAADQPPGAIAVSADGVYVTCGSSSRLRLEQVQVEGRKRITAPEFANGARLAPGERFGG
jgi:methionyl-tRNA formyltransferase